MTVPNFLIIGAPKAGTTSMYEYLRQHPQVFMPDDKEPYFFARSRTATELAAYLELFAPRTSERAVGEASTNYLFRPQAPGLIRDYDRDMKLIAVVRNPVDRAFSHYHYNIHLRLESHASFEDALAAEENGAADPWYLKYVEMGLYAKQLRRYYEVFHREQILVLLYDDIRTQLPQILKRTFAFLGVDDTFKPDISVLHNRTRVPKNRTVHSLLQGVADSGFIRRGLGLLRLEKRLRSVGRKLSFANSTPLPEVHVETRKRLISSFREDCLDLQQLINRDLSSWLELDNRKSRSRAEAAEAAR